MSKPMQQGDGIALGSDEGPRGRDAILKATLELLAEQGYQRMAMEQVAARAGVHKATLYRWWPSKGNLVGWALGATLDRGPVPDTGNTRDDLIAWLQVTIANYTSTPAGTALPALLSDLAHEPGTLAGFRRHFLDGRRANCEVLINRGIERGDIPEDVDVEIFMDIIAGPVFYRQVVTGVNFVDDLAEKIVDLLMTGQVPRRT
ncbi:transcriptional regulator, TetR family [Streptomyces sp. 2323.1]|uniref:TetR/AcrR family transcriptional regulator n=1 Tax=Streptomyces sp. 2323.1 TaxID=1938841 RepID=UPI000BBFE81F|nr:TetR/AcrR family transcriptional regulator [Streptomyces sp. 2323.1]SOE15876.1 transcriptional regulator, TetR family [Streptomyces sp. 2323.1]